MEVRAITPADAETIASWRYPGEYATYDLSGPAELSDDPWAVDDAGELVGYCCFGAPARVLSADPREGTLDVGYGLAPELMGQGRGGAFVGAVLRFATASFDPELFRLYVLEWNERSLRVAEAAGFRRESVLENDQGRFRVLSRPSWRAQAE